MADTFIPYGKQEISDEDIAAVTSALKSDFLTQGPAVEDFEKTLRSLCDAKYAVAVSNGTTALHLAYSALGIKENDAVFVPAITFAATANAVLYCGGTPVFVDVDEKNGFMSLASLKEAFNLSRKEGLNPKAVATVHLGGRPYLPTELIQFCKENHVFLVEDACHALGGEVRLCADDPFEKIGSAFHSDAVVFSFHPVKHITTGEGGAVLTRKEDIAKKLFSLRSHGITKTQADFVDKDQAFNTAGELNPWYQEMQSLGFNYRVNEIQAALGASQLKRLGQNIEARRKLADFYRKEFKSLKNISCPLEDSHLTKNAYHLFPLQVDFERAGKTRASVMEELKKLGIGTQVHYLPVPFHPYYKNNKGLACSTPMKGAKAYYEKTLSIPMYPGLLEKGKERVVEAIRAVIG